MIRWGTEADIERVMFLMDQMCASSRYACVTNVNWGLSSLLCKAAIDPTNQAMCMFVGEKSSVIESFLIGSVAPLFGIGDKLTAADLFFYSSPMAHKRDSFRLIEAFTAWAESIPGVIEVNLSAIGAIGPWKTNVKMYERFGYTVDGAYCRKEIVNV